MVGFGQTNIDTVLMLLSQQLPAEGLECTSHTKACIWDNTEHHHPSCTNHCYYIKGQGFLAKFVLSSGIRLSRVVVAVVVFPVEEAKELYRVGVFSLGGNNSRMGEMPNTLLIPIRTDHTLALACAAASAEAVSGSTLHTDPCPT